MSHMVPKTIPFFMVFLFSVSVLSTGMFWVDEAEAHKGHGGKKIVFLKKKPILKALLPTEGKVYRRKQRLDSDQADWAREVYGVDLKSKVYAFYVSKDRDTKKQQGAAIIYKFSYRHGYCELAVGLDMDNNVKTTAFVSINEKYLVDFEETVGTGFLNSFDGMSMQELVDTAKASSKENKATREFTDAMRDAAITLVAFQQ